MLSSNVFWESYFFHDTEKPSVFHSEFTNESHGAWKLQNLAFFFSTVVPIQLIHPGEGPLEFL